MTSNVLLPWIHSAGEGGERKSIQTFQGNGTTGPWEFNFAGGYIERAHVKAYRYDPVLATSHPQVLTFIGSNQITTSEPIPANQYLVLYRDTPKDAPLVDYNEGAVLNEKNLDTTAQQAVFAAAEMVDRFDSINTTSNEAIQRSVLALNTANTALGNSETAVSDATYAVAAANAASAAASDAGTTASAAASTANGIDSKAQTALDNSVTAVNTANAASATANGIDAKATQAQTDAAAAVLTANAALASTGNVDGKADIHSPALTGSPTAPTPASDDASTRIATTAHVKAVVTQGYAPKAHTHTAAQISDVSTVGRSVLVAADAAAARAAIGAGTSNLTLGSSAGQAKPGDWKPNISMDTVGQLPWSRLTDVPSTDSPLSDVGAVGSLAFCAVAHSGWSLTTGGWVAASDLNRVQVSSVFLDEFGKRVLHSYIDSGSPALAGTWKALTASSAPYFYNPGFSLCVRVA